jgi:hypothetical protein
MILTPTITPFETLLDTSHDDECDGGMFIKDEYKWYPDMDTVTYSFGKVGVTA